jgi:uncharacterized protein (TIGR00269 family)
MSVALCTICKRKEADFKRPYSGEKLCTRCFCHSIENKVRKTIAKYEMFKPTDKIMVAVSGGKDSLALLHILARIEKVFPKASLRAVTVDEGIKGYRDEALKFAFSKCRELGIDHTVMSFQELYGHSLDEIVKTTREKRKSSKGLTPCAYCGVLRRRALNLAARKVGVDKLATGHNLDDEAQTILLNILNGDVLRIARVKPVLSEAHPKFVQRVKPMCEVPEREISLYTYLKRIEVQSVPCPFAPTALRSDIRVMLNRMEEKHAGIKFALIKSMERIRPALEAVEEEVKLQDCRECGEPAGGEICRSCQILQKLNI